MNRIDEFIGKISLFPYLRVPEGYLACKGQLLQIEKYQALYCFIGNNFGGDGLSTFRLPDLQNAVPSTMQYCIVEDGTWPSGGVDEYVGKVSLYSYYRYVNFTAYYPCYGREMDTRADRSLFSLIGYNYGGKNNYFRLPKLQGAEPQAGLEYFIVGYGVYPEFTNSNVAVNEYLGKISLFAYRRVPYGYLVCDGRILSINEFEELYSLIGTRFGGDGHNTFALPNLKGAEPLPEMQYCILVNGIYPHFVQ